MQPARFQLRPLGLAILLVALTAAGPFGQADTLEQIARAVIERLNLARGGGANMPPPNDGDYDSYSSEQLVTVLENIRGMATEASANYLAPGITSVEGLYVTEGYNLTNIPRVANQPRWTRYLDERVTPTNYERRKRELASLICELKIVILDPGLMGLSAQNTRTSRGSSPMANALEERDLCVSASEPEVVDEDSYDSHFNAGVCEC